MTAITLFGFGVFISTMVAAMWHAVQTSVETGGKRRMHFMIVVSMIFILASIGFSAPEAVTRAGGATLAIAGILLASIEAGRERTLCAASICFGFGVALGLPYSLA